MMKEIATVLNALVTRIPFVSWDGRSCAEMPMFQDMEWQEEEKTGKTTVAGNASRQRLRR